MEKQPIDLKVHRKRAWKKGGLEDNHTVRTFEVTALIRSTTFSEEADWVISFVANVEASPLQCSA